MSSGRVKGKMRREHSVRQIPGRPARRPVGASPREPGLPRFADCEGLTLFSLGAFRKSRIRGKLAV